MRLGRLLRAVALVSLISIVAAVAPGRQVSAEPSSQAGDFIVVADTQFPDNLNPFQSTLPISQRIMALTWAHLIGFTDQQQPFADLAQAVPTTANGDITDGGRTITVHLKPNLRWSDGAPMTSADIAFGWHVEMDPASGPACSGTCDVITSIDTPDPVTAVLHLSRPDPTVLADLPEVIPSHVFAASGQSQAAQTLYQDQNYNYESSSYVTSGPYQVTTFVTGDRVVLSPNPYYTATVGPYLSTIIFAYYADKPGEMAAAAQGTVDESQGYVPSDIGALESQQGQYTLSLSPSQDFDQLTYNVDSTYQGRPNPLSDIKVRRALNMAIDRVSLCQQVYSLDAATCARSLQEGPIPPDSLPRISAPQGLGYNPAEAKSLLASSSFAGQPITLDMATTTDPVHTAQMAAIAQDWAAIGVQVHQSSIPPATFLGEYGQNGTLATGNFQVGLWAYGNGPYPDELRTIYDSHYIDREQSSHSLLNENFGGIHDSQIDADFAQAAATIDDAQRQQLFSDLDQRIVSQAYMLTLDNRPNIATVDRKLGYFFPRPDGINTWNGFEWYSTATHPTPPPALAGGSTSQPPSPGPSATATPIGTSIPQPAGSNPPSEPVPQPVIPKTTKVLNSATLANLIPPANGQQFDGSRTRLVFRFRHSTRLLRSLRKGNVLVVPPSPLARLGLFRKVTGIKQNTEATRTSGRRWHDNQATGPSPDWSTEVDTSSATLKQTLGTQDILTSTTISGPKWQQSVDLGNGVTGTASVSIPSIGVYFHLYDGDQHFYLTLTPSIELRLSFTVTIIGVSGSADKDIDLKSPVKIPIATGIAIFVNAFWRLHVDYDFHEAVSQAVVVTASGSGCTWYDTNGWGYATGHSCVNGTNNANTLGTDFAPDVHLDPSIPKVEKVADFTASFGPHLQFLLDDVIGPNIGVEGYAHFHSNGSTWMLQPGIDVPASIHANFLVGSKDFGDRILRDFPLKEVSGSVPGSQPTATPVPQLHGYPTSEAAIEAQLQRNNPFSGQPGITSSMTYTGACHPDTLPPLDTACSYSIAGAVAPPVYAYGISPGLGYYDAGESPDVYWYLGEYSDGSWTYLGQAPCRTGHNPAPPVPLNQCLGQHAPAFNP